jgi:hypothetical protein
MSEHTPGPWHYDENTSTIYGTPPRGTREQTGPGGEFHTAEPNALYEVCTVNQVRCYEYWDGGGKHHPVDENVAKRMEEWSTSNASLITAALELLEALKGIVRGPCPIVTHDRPDCEWCAGLRAIAKATGGAVNEVVGLRDAGY